MVITIGIEKMQKLTQWVIYYLLIQNLFNVLIMDSTYKTNRYLMPLFEVVGVAPTGKIFFVAFVFLKNEKEDSYIWELEHLKLLIDSDDFSKAVVTDRELALVNA